MQKIINGIAILSGVVSLAVVGSGVFIYVQKDAIIEGVKENIKEQVMGGVTGALPGIVGESIPSLPEATGPALPF